VNDLMINAFFFLFALAFFVDTFSALSDTGANTATLRICASFSFSRCFFSRGRVRRINPVGKFLVIERHHYFSCATEENFIGNSFYIGFDLHSMILD